MDVKKLQSFLAKVLWTDKTKWQLYFLEWGGVCGGGVGAWYILPNLRILRKENHPYCETRRRHTLVCCILELLCCLWHWLPRVWAVQDEVRSLSRNFGGKTYSLMCSGHWSNRIIIQIIRQNAEWIRRKWLAISLDPIENLWNSQMERRHPVSLFKTSGPNDELRSAEISFRSKESTQSKPWNPTFLYY